MIEMVSGVIAEASVNSVLVGTASGLSFRIFCHARLADALGNEGDDIALVTALVVNQGEPSLYGFFTPLERTCFNLLQKASGIGPRLAHAILGVFDVDDLAVAISGADVKSLSRVPGLGAKKAERLVRELKGGFDLPEKKASGATPLSVGRSDIEKALVGLGFEASPVRDAVRAIVDEAPGIDDATLLRRALRALGSKP